MTRNVTDKTFKMSIINGVVPLGCFTGVFVGFFLKKKFTYKQTIFIADFIGCLSLLTLIKSYEVIVAFRFTLGFANGISSLVMPIYVKTICPEIYFS